MSTTIDMRLDWRVSDSAPWNILDADGENILGFASWRDDTSEAKIAFAVRAVNAYTVLLDALRAWNVAYTTWGVSGFGKPDYDAALAQSRAAERVALGKEA